MYALAWRRLWDRAERRLRKLVHNALLAVTIWSHAHIYRPDLLHGAPRATIIRPDDEHHPLHALERMLEHQALHFAVVCATPASTRQEAPPNFKDASLSIEIMIARGADDLATRPLNGQEGAARIQCLGEELAKHVLFITIRVRVLRPNEWI